MNSPVRTLTAVASPDAFAHVEHWVFDLDNTLYPRATGIHLQMDVRIRDFVAVTLGISPEKAYEVQKSYYRDHGTTLRGLMNDHGINPDAFLSYVHDLDYSPILAAPKLSAAIARLPGRKFIFTNGDRAHAERVAAKLGIAEHFEDIFDIVSADLEPKPARITYEKFIREHRVAPERAAMFEDLARNLVVPHELGMKTVLIQPEEDGVPRYAWEALDGEAPHVHFITQDLAGFLSGLIA